MKNKGFTLTEILGVVVILGLILLVIGPPILNRLNSQEEKVSTLQKEMISESAKLYLENNKDKYLNDNVYCISIKELIDNNYLNSDFKDVTSKEKLTEKHIKVLIQNNTYNFTIPSDCEKTD